MSVRGYIRGLQSVGGSDGQIFIESGGADLKAS